MLNNLKKWLIDKGCNCDNLCSILRPKQTRIIALINNTKLWIIQDKINFINSLWWYGTTSTGNNLYFVNLLYFINNIENFYKSFFIKALKALEYPPAISFLASR